MTLPFIPDEILAEIMKVLAQAEVSYLSPFVCAGKRTSNIAGTAEVLQKCNFTDLIHQNHEDIMSGGRVRRFFERYCEGGNLEAVYVEGLPRHPLSCIIRCMFWRSAKGERIVSEIFVEPQRSPGRECQISRE
ncbi:unnamed protein product [Microthlaspi erraticum]|uniref:Uncharacterized protein n=1 Tax=Microthlaspi erraticum TaxID=1685480 RepID=A0A6D2JKK7_9BRAS|nr:unnamed protein product [Microthlaspi erraticum]